MQGRDFLEIVDQLSPNESEASQRTQLGRLYYAVYLEARGWCEQHLAYQRTRSSREHGEVARMLGSQDQGLVDALTFLRSYRNTADYDMEASSETIVKQLGDARVFAMEALARLVAWIRTGTVGNCKGGE